MKKSFFLVSVILFLNGCMETTALLGPAYTITKTGNVVQSAGSLAASYGVQQTTGKTPGQHVISLLTKNKKIENTYIAKKVIDGLRVCETTHSNSLNEIFFQTLDELDCIRDPFNFAN